MELCFGVFVGNVQPFTAAGGNGIIKLFNNHLYAQMGAKLFHPLHFQNRAERKRSISNCNEVISIIINCIKSEWNEILYMCNIRVDHGSPSSFLRSYPPRCHLKVPSNLLQYAWEQRARPHYLNQLALKFSILLLLLKPEKLNVNVSLITVSVVLNGAVGKIPSPSNGTDACPHRCQSQRIQKHVSAFLCFVTPLIM